MYARTGLALLLSVTLTDGAAKAQMAHTGKTSGAQVDYRWFDAFGNGGIIVAGVRNAAGSYIRLLCNAGGNISEPEFQYERKSGRLQDNETIQIVVGENVFHFTFGKTGFAQVSGRSWRIELDGFASALATTGATSFAVEIPRLKSSEIFSTKDAGKVLKKSEKTLVSGCG